MALKHAGDITLETDISLVNDSVASRGVVLVYKSGSGGSGVGIGEVGGTATLSASASGQKPAGLLLNDQVDIDETRYHRNFHKDEMKINEKCTLLKKGRRTTDKIASGATPVAGDTAYLTSNGELTPTVSSTGGIVATPKVGQFKSGKDEDGYATVDFNLPIV